jgi:hypothetical protein
MRMQKRLYVTLALLWALGGADPGWAGVRPIDNCQTLEAGDQVSFILVENISSQGQDCLIVNSSNLTIDLNGFSIIGNGAGKGIVSDASISGVTVRNGTVKGFAIGVALSGSGNIIEDVHVENNTDTGMLLGAGNLVHHAVVQGNFKAGARLSTGSTIKDSIVRANGNSPESFGISAAPGCTVKGNSVSTTIGTGIFASSGSTVLENTVLDTNPGVGMSIICPSNVQFNTATGNTIANLVLVGDGCSDFFNVAP